MKRLTDFIDQALSWFLITLMGLMVLTVSWQVATRYLLNSPSSYTEELATYLLIWISLLGSVLALRHKAHLGIDIVVRKWRGKSREFAHTAVHIAVIAFAILVFIYGGFRLVAITLKLGQLSAAFQIPVGYVYTVLPLSGLLLVYYSLYALATSTRNGDGPSDVAVAIE